MADITPPRVSVITPVYNAGATIADTIRSLQSQEYPNWEMLVTDDGSTDGTRALLRAFSEGDPRIRVARQPNAGRAAARNAAIRRASGRYLAFLDADDMWAPAKLSAQVQYMEQTGRAFTCTAAAYLRDNGQPLRKTALPRPTVDYRQLLRLNTIVCSSVMLDREQIDCEMPDMGHEDYAAWLSILRTGTVAYGLPDALTLYRLRRGNAGSASANKARSLRWVYRIYRECLGMKKPEALARLAVYGIYGIGKYAGNWQAVFR